MSERASKETQDVVDSYFFVPGKTHGPKEIEAEKSEIPGPNRVNNTHTAFRSHSLGPFEDGFFQNSAVSVDEEELKKKREFWSK